MPHSKFPNFNASLLRKKGYGYDVSGDVTDQKQVNMHDLSLLQTDPHPQQGTQTPSAMTMADGAKFYHGTTLRVWQGEIPDQLLLTTDLKTAEIAAHDAAESNTYKEPGLENTEQPIVLFIKFVHIKGHDLQPNPNHAIVYRDGTWQDSIRTSGTLVVSGDMAGLKPKFQLVQS